jgi:hypothetical protein
VRVSEQATERDKILRQQVSPVLDSLCSRLPVVLDTPGSLIDSGTHEKVNLLSCGKYSSFKHR